MRLSKDLFPLEVGGFGFGLVDLGHRAGQHVLVDQQEVGIFARADATALIIDKHLPGDVDGERLDGLFAGDALFGPCADSPRH